MSGWLKKIILAATLLPVLAFAEVESEYWPVWNASDEYNLRTISHSDFDRVLGKYVVTNHPSGINRFRYGDVTRSDRKQLDGYIDDLADIDPRKYRREEQKAYWLNLYNALTIQAVLAEYPIAKINSDKFKNKHRVAVADIKLSLNDIENRILRPLWQDHKVIFGLSCATLGCPNIQSQAFTAANTRDLLKQAGKEFINHPRGLQFDKKNMQASRLFDWYSSDFAKGDDRKLMKLFAYYAEDNKALYILGYQGKIRYAYDERVNSPEQKWQQN